MVNAHISLARMLGAKPIPVITTGFSMATSKSLFIKGLSVELIDILAIPWPRPFMPIAEVMLRPYQTSLIPFSPSARVIRLCSAISSLAA